MRNRPDVSELYGWRLDLEPEAHPLAPARDAGGTRGRVVLLDEVAVVIGHDVDTAVRQVGEQLMRISDLVRAPCRRTPEPVVPADATNE